MIHNNDKKFIKLYEDAVQTTDTFKTEYKANFKRVLNFEADMREFKNKLILQEKRIKELKVLNYDKPFQIAQNKLLSDVDDRFIGKIILYF